MAIQSVDGLLVGGASLKSEFTDMVRICDEAKWVHNQLNMIGICLFLVLHFWNIFSLFHLVSFKLLEGILKTAYEFN